MSKSSKGGQFERDMCRRLSRWWVRGRDDIFWRTSNSGGRATTRSRKGKRTEGQYGDIRADDPRGDEFLRLFCVELKTGYKKNGFLDPLETTTQGSTQLEKFLDQARTQAVAAGSYTWLLIWRRTGRKPIVVLDSYIFNMLWAVAGPFDSYCTLTSMERIVTVTMVPLDYFLTHVRRRHVKELIENIFDH